MASQQLVSALAALTGSHDLRLPAWGPYTKRYMGIAHIPNARAGLRFDLSVFPGLYRRSVQIPNVTWESGYHPWEAAPDLSYFSHRHEIIWKDQVYGDIAFCRLDGQAALIRCECVNRTGEAQQLVLHYMASLHFPPICPYSNEPIRPCRVTLPPDAVWIDGLAYADIHYARFDPRAHLTYDGQIRGEVRDHGFVDGQGLGQWFGADAGDWVTYRPALPRALDDAVLLMRYRMNRQEQVRLTLTGLVNQEIDLAGSGEFAVYGASVGNVKPGDELTLTSHGGAQVQLDGLALVPAANEDQIHFAPVVWNPTPERRAGPRPDTLILKYEHADNFYGLAWRAPTSEVREFICDDLDTWMRYKVHEHVQQVLRGPGEGHFTNVFMRPIFMPPDSAQVLYGLVCSGDSEAVRRRLATFDAASVENERVFEQARARAIKLAPNPSGQAYRFSQERMAATVLSNVVYPVRTRGTWIRHYTPGRWWDCLYTWDSGFIGLGLLELDIERAIDNLNAYLTEPGERDAAFIHHGSPVPTQFYLFLELWNRTQSRELLEYFYPRLQQYHRFMAGRLGSSTTRTLKSGLIRTWDYFYNSGGWDDYPPQVYVHRNSLENCVAPLINTSHAIRTAKILRMAARALDEAAAKEATGEYDEDVAGLTASLQRYAWDEASGYFGYVCHDDAGQPTEILRHTSGANFDMGFDGASPLIAGACTPEQEARLIDHLMSPEHLWSRCGLSAVDQSAPYYRDDGYWNGTVWMPHQWFFWKTLLDLGRADEAYRIAQTALDVWRREVESSYNCFEHFIIQSGRGAGWHHFGGLSSPVLNWYSAYHRPGRLTTGLDVWITSLTIAPDNSSLTADLELHGPAHQTPVVIATLDASRSYTATWNGQPILSHERHAGTLEIQLPAGAQSGRLVVAPLARRTDPSQ